MRPPSYRGRFAPSPTGALHAGSFVAALASWLDARAHGGTWLVRIEDVDAPRCVPGADREILRQLEACGLRSDEPVVWQSQRASLYQHALDSLVSTGHAYPCGCTRKDIENALAAAGRPRTRHDELLYPGTCRGGLHGRAARAWRFRVGGEGASPREAPQMHGRGTPARDREDVHWIDRRMGPQSQDVSRTVGDFVLKRADGLFAYQLAVVVDDAAQRVTHVVRGEDLADNTARQILLQRALSLPTPAYLHTHLVLGPNGEKLSKQNGALAVDVADPLKVLRNAGSVLGVEAASARDAANWLRQALPAWAQKFRASARREDLDPARLSTAGPRSR